MINLLMIGRKLKKISEVVRRNAKQLVEEMISCCGAVERAWKIMQSLHSKRKHRDARETHNFVAVCLWLPCFSKDLISYVKNCDACQQIRDPDGYKTPFYVPQGNVFQNVP